MWTPTKTELINAILEELTKRGKPTSFGVLWGALQDRFGSKTTFNLYLKTLVQQGIVRREARKKLPDGRWITVKRGRTVRYSLAKASPLSPDASPERIREWIEENLRNSKINLLAAIEHCLKGEGDWEDLYSEFEKAIRLNLKMWWGMARSEGFQKAAEEPLKKIDCERKELEKSPSREPKS